MSIKLKTLDNIFRNSEGGFTVKHEGKCCKCLKSTTISITKTSSGYGFLGGVLHEDKDSELLIECAECFEPEKQD